MKLTLPAAVLAPALAAVGRVVERRNTIPILGHVALEAADGRVVLRATDLDIEARMSLAAHVDRPGALTVSSHILNEVIRKAPEGSVTLEAEESGARLAIRAGRFRTTLNALPIIDFPDFTAGDLPVRFMMPGAALAEALAATSFAISTEETRYYLNGIFAHRAGDALVMVATDGHRLAKWSTPAPEGTEGLPGILIPRKTVGEIARAFADGEILIEASDSKIRLTKGDLVLTSKLIDGTFPDYGRVIPAERGEGATWDRAELMAAIERVTTVAIERGRAIKFAIGSAGTTLSVVNPDSGSATEDLTHHGDLEVEAGFNSRYALDMLAALKGASVRVETADAGSPSRWTPAEPPPGTAGQALYVLMPMRV